MSVNRYNATTDTMEHIAGNEAIILDEVPTEGSNNAVKSGGVFAELANKANLTQISNPNLLDNPWFTVNQRGQSSYSGNVYGYDRWKLGSSGMSISKSNDIFTVSAMNQYSTLVQKFPIDYIKEGDTYTLSVLFDDDTIESKTFVANANSPSFLGEWTHGNRKFNSLITGQYNNQWQVIPFDYLGSNIETPVTISFKAIKLEKGTVSTLAMDTAPNYATELLKCQRYCIALNQSKIGYDFVGQGIAWSNSQVTAIIPIPVTMRAKPSITDISKWVLFNPSRSATITSANVAVLSGNSIKIEFNTSSEAVQQGDIYMIGSGSIGDLLLLSADL